MSGGVFVGADDGGAEGEDFVGEAGVDGPGRDAVEVDRLVPQLLSKGLDQANDAGLGGTVGGEIRAGFGGAAAGEGDDFGPARGAGELGVEAANGEERAVEIGAHGGAPTGGIGGDGGADLTLKAGTADQAVDVRPSGGDLGGGGGDLGPVGDIAAGGGEGTGVKSGEVGLIGTRKAPDAVAGSEEAGGEGAADARAGAGEDEIHAGDFSRGMSLARRARRAGLTTPRSELHPLDGIGGKDARGFAAGFGGVVHDEVGVDAGIFAGGFIRKEQFETDGGSVPALVAADGDEAEAVAGANDVDDAATRVGIAQVLRIDLGGKRSDGGLVADVGPAGGPVVEFEKVEVALENILAAGESIVGGEAVDVADLDALALPVNEPGDDQGGEGGEKPFHVRRMRGTVGRLAKVF